MNDLKMVYKLLFKDFTIMHNSFEESELIYFVFAKRLKSL